MGTAYSVPIEMFFRKIEKDISFFEYFNLTPDEAMVLAQDRATGYLDEAVAKIVLKCHPASGTFDKDDTESVFAGDLTQVETAIIASLMYESYLSREFAYIKTINVNYTPKELTVFDPSNARSTFLKIYETICNENAGLLEEYRNSDRYTGEYIKTDFSINDEE